MPERPLCYPTTCTAPNNGMHPTADTLALIFGNGAGRRVMPGVRFLPLRGAMKYQSSINIRNASEGTLLFHLEPWGEQIGMPIGATFTVTAEAEQQGFFEVEHGENEITL